jgi:hypothetical protein
MSHGAPDYSNVLKPEFTHRLDDLGELAARQSNLVSLERRGETVYLEDFSLGIKQWATGFNGTGGKVSLDATEYITSGFSCLLTAGSDGAKYAQITKRFPYMGISKVGAEIRFLHDLNLDYIYFILELHDGTKRSTVYMKYHYATEIIEINVPTTGWVTVLSNVDAPYPGVYFSIFKVVADFANGLYQRVYFNNYSADLTDYALNTGLSASDPYVLYQVTCYGDAGTNSKLYLDNFILTRNE